MREARQGLEILVTGGIMSYGIEFLPADFDWQQAQQEEEQQMRNARRAEVMSEVAIALVQGADKDATADLLQKYREAGII
jgi:hypothetical protein